MKKILLGVIALLCMNYCSNKNIKSLNHEEKRVWNTVSKIGQYADQHQWKKLNQVFYKNVLLDYASFIGKKPANLKPEQITGSWKNLLPGFDKTMHFVHPVKISVNGNEANCFSSVMAVHYIKGKQTWKVYGYYDHHLVKTASKWKVDKMKFIFTFQEGDLTLPKLAAKRMKEKGVK